MFADDQAIGSAKTNQYGEWVLVTERHIPNPNPKLTVQAGAVAKQWPVEQTATSPSRLAPATASVTARLIDELKSRIERARAEQLNPDVGKSEGRFSALDTEVGAVPPAKAHTEDAVPVSSREVTPVPIKFIFREAEFSAEGRLAAQLLLEYISIKKPSSIAMTGHADERGTSAFNMELSSLRLANVVRFLRAGGYKGTIEVFPKGETEPFTGVDRASVALDELYELDRRVELLLAN